MAAKGAAKGAHCEPIRSEQNPLSNGSCWLVSVRLSDLEACVFVRWSYLFIHLFIWVGFYFISLFHKSSLKYVLPHSWMFMLQFGNWGFSLQYPLLLLLVVIVVYNIIITTTTTILLLLLYSPHFVSHEFGVDSHIHSCFFVHILKLNE